MNGRSLSRKAFEFFLALLVGSCFLALPAFAASHSTADAQPVFSDFDGDNKLDQAELFSNGRQKNIQVAFGKFEWKSLSFDSGVQDRGRLVSDDIDSDGDTDLLWVSQSYPRRFVLWLGDGRGNFSRFTGREEDRLKVLLNWNSEARLAGDDDEEQPSCILQSSGAVAMPAGSSLSPYIRSGRSPLAEQPSGIHPACLSVILKRGPPSKVS